MTNDLNAAWLTLLRSRRRPLAAAASSCSLVSSFCCSSSCFFRADSGSPLWQAWMSNEDSTLLFDETYLKAFPTWKKPLLSHVGWTTVMEVFWNGRDQYCFAACVVTAFIYQLPGVSADTGLLVQDLHEFVHLVVAERDVGHGGQQLAVRQQQGVCRVSHLEQNQDKTFRI